LKNHGSVFRDQRNVTVDSSDVFFTIPVNIVICMPHLRGPQFGFSGLFSVILIILLVVMLVGIVAAMLFGTVKITVKGGYFSPVAGDIHIDGKDVIRIEHRGGDVLILNNSSGIENVYPVAFFIQAPSAMVEVHIAPSTRSMFYRPGDAVYVYHTSAGYFLSDTGAAIHPDRDVFPETVGSKAYIVIMDRTANVTIARLGPF
jgi:hypothetical protein